MLITNGDQQIIGSRVLAASKHQEEYLPEDADLKGSIDECICTFTLNTGTLRVQAPCSVIDGNGESAVIDDLVGYIIEYVENDSDGGNTRVCLAFDNGAQLIALSRYNGFYDYMSNSADRYFEITFIETKT